jgi:hypothetical protein
MKYPTDARFGSIDDWGRATGMARRTTYHQIAAGNLKSHKIGRLLFIDMQHGFAWLEACPPAEIRPSPPRRPPKAPDTAA